MTVETYEARDVPEIAPIHRDAFQGYLNVKLGRRYVSAFLRWFAEHPEYAIALAAHHNDRIVGYVVGVDMAHDRKMTRDLQPVAMLGLIKHPLLVFDGSVRDKVKARLRAMRNPEARLDVEPPALPEPVMGLIGIGVSSEARGHRIGSALMDAFEQSARERGYRSMLLSVYPHNRAARGLYERHGWSVPPGDPFEGRALYYAKTLD